MCVGGGGYLFHVERADGGRVHHARFANDGFDELHLGCDVGHLDGVVVVIGDVQSVLKGHAKEWFAKPSRNSEQRKETS